MASGKYSFVIEQGATTDFQIVYKDSNGSPIDLTGYTAAMQIRDSQGGSTLYATLTSSLGDSYSKTADVSFLSLSGSNLTTPQASGSIGVYIGHELTTTMNFGEAYYDIEITNGVARERLLEGKVQLRKQVTTV
jgi:hypothetical protein